MKNKKFFTTTLLRWNLIENKRKMPWKGEKDPYKIWISEIILQQTRVNQGVEYYNRFIKHFPDIEALAAAPEQEVYKLWEGLGYYTRCRNLIGTAKFIHLHLGGEFPEAYEDILSLKGIGSYTASAIASFAFNQPYAVLDGNVFRVLARFFGIGLPVNSIEGKKLYRELSQSLLDEKDPASYNQAIMDFGAIVCKPSSPLCTGCVLGKKCFAFRNKRVNEFPVNTKVNKQKARFFNYIIARYKNRFYVRKRIEKDIWQNLYEFILIETGSPAGEKEIFSQKEFVSLFDHHEFEIECSTKASSQKLTHQIVHARFYCIKLSKPLENNKQYFLASKEEMKSLPFPKLITLYFT